MKLLIVTQKVDAGDPILGFFLGWLQAFSTRVSSLSVIAQSVGPHTLPELVEIYSLRKERGWPRWHQIVRFLWLIIQTRGQYEAVLVHMTPVWVVIGAPIWFLLRKRVYLWYEVKRGGYLLKMALRCVRCVFSASPSGLPDASAKNVVLGHGIDTEVFSSVDEPREKHLLATIGRVTRIKHFEVIIDAVGSLSGSFHLVIGGGPVTGADRQVLEGLHRRICERGLEGRVHIGFLSQHEVVSLLRRASLFLHASGGGLDKAVLEAMACECPVISSSEAAHFVLPPACRATDTTMADRARAMLLLPEEYRRSLGRILRRSVAERHNVQQLVQRLVTHMQV